MFYNQSNQVEDSDYSHKMCHLRLNRISTNTYLHMDATERNRQDLLCLFCLKIIQQALQITSNNILVCGYPLIFTGPPTI